MNMEELNRKMNEFYDNMVQEGYPSESILMAMNGYSFGGLAAINPALIPSACDAAKMMTEIMGVVKGTRSHVVQ
jgi:hypothetical protein